MGEVYRATQSSLGRQVAIKVLASASDGTRVVVSSTTPSRSLVVADGVPAVTR